MAWKSWVRMPLPGQDSDACDGQLPCPLMSGNPVNFTYPLHIEKFWMRVRNVVVVAVVVVVVVVLQCWFIKLLKHIYLFFCECYITCFV